MLDFKEKKNRLVLNILVYFWWITYDAANVKEEG